MISNLCFLSFFFFFFFFLFLYYYYYFSFLFNQLFPANCCLQKDTQLNTVFVILFPDIFIVLGPIDIDVIYSTLIHPSFLRITREFQIFLLHFSLCVHPFSLFPTFLSSFYSFIQTSFLPLNSWIFESLNPWTSLSAFRTEQGRPRPLPNSEVNFSSVSLRFADMLQQKFPLAFLSLSHSTSLPAFINNYHWNPVSFRRHLFFF